MSTLVIHIFYFNITPNLLKKCTSRFSVANAILDFEILKMALKEIEFTQRKNHKNVLADERDYNPETPYNFSYYINQV